MQRFIAKTVFDMNSGPLLQKGFELFGVLVGCRPVECCFPFAVNFVKTKGILRRNNDT